MSMQFLSAVTDAESIMFVQFLSVIALAICFLIIMSITKTIEDER